MLFQAVLQNCVSCLLVWPAAGGVRLHRNSYGYGCFDVFARS